MAVDKSDLKEPLSPNSFIITRIIQEEAEDEQLDFYLL